MDWLIQVIKSLLTLIFQIFTFTCHLVEIPSYFKPKIEENKISENILEASSPMIELKDMAYSIPTEIPNVIGQEIEGQLKPSESQIAKMQISSDAQPISAWMIPGKNDPNLLSQGAYYGK